jgi:hypothetical protein
MPQATKRIPVVKKKIPAYKITIDAGVPGMLPIVDRSRFRGLTD